jgi:hypothetical protein
MVTRDEYWTRDAAADDADRRHYGDCHQDVRCVDGGCECKCHDYEPCDVPPVIECRWRASAWAGFKEPPGCIAATCARCGDCAKHCVCDVLDSLNDVKESGDGTTIDPGHEAK